MNMETQVGDHGTAALAISLPFACVLGLFSSLSTTKMVSRRYVWIYSAAQFLFIVLFTHIFYRYVSLCVIPPSRSLPLRLRTVYTSVVCEPTK